MSNHSALGAAGVPFGAAKVEETEVRFLLAERVGIDAKRKRRVGMAELRLKPPNALPRRQRELQLNHFSVLGGLGSVSSCREVSL